MKAHRSTRHLISASTWAAIAPALMVSSAPAAQITTISTVTTVGTYDENSVQANTVDRNANGDTINSTTSATDVAKFTTTVNAAFTNNRGGVINFDNANGGAITTDTATQTEGHSFTASYGTAQTKSLSITPTTSSSVGYFFHASSSNVTTISGGYELFAGQPTGNETLTFGPITGGATGEKVTQVGFTLLGRANSANDPITPSVRATFSDGTTSTLNSTSYTNANPTTKDTFYSFVAPLGASISSVNIIFANNASGDNRLGIDDLGFITTATTSYTLTAAASGGGLSNDRLTQGASTTITGTITNTGTGAADALNYTGLNIAANSGTITNGTLPKSGGPVANGGGTDSGTSTFTAGATGTATLIPSVSTATNATLGGNASLSGTTAASVKVDALVEHVTSNSDSGNAATTSTAAYRQLAGYGGHDLGSVPVTKTGPGDYVPGYADNINSGNGFTHGTLTVDVAPAGQSFNGDIGVFLLDFGDSPDTGDMASLDADLSSFGYSFYDAVTGAHNGISTAGILTTYDPHLGAGHAYDLELNLGGTGSSNPTYFDFDFGKYSAGSGLAVRNIAVVPEPTSLLIVSGVGALLLMRRRRKLIR